MTNFQWFLTCVYAAAITAGLIGALGTVVTSKAPCKAQYPAHYMHGGAPQREPQADCKTK